MTSTKIEARIVMNTRPDGTGRVWLRSIPADAYHAARKTRGYWRTKCTPPDIITYIRLFRSEDRACEALTDLLSVHGRKLDCPIPPVDAAKPLAPRRADIGRWRVWDLAAGADRPLACLVSFGARGDPRIARRRVNAKASEEWHETSLELDRDRRLRAALLDLLLMRCPPPGMRQPGNSLIVEAG